MVKDQEVKEAREAHRRALARGARPTRANDPESKVLREHRLAHHWNISHEEEREKRAVPDRVPWNNQIPLSMGESDE